MKYNDKYFGGGENFHNRSFLHKIKNIFFSKKHGITRYNEILKYRWNFLKNNKKILDIGCGKGEFMKFVPENKEIFGTDIANSTLKGLEEQGYNVKDKGDVEKKLPYNKNEFDAVYMSHVLEHLNKPSKALQEIKRVLKNNGKLVIVTPNFSFKEFYSDYTHQRPYTKMSLFRIFSDNDFENIQIINGHCHSKIIAIFFYPFPKLRYKIERFLGFFSPSEYITVGRNIK